MELATLQVKIQSGDAIRETKELGKALDGTAVSAEVLEKRAASLARAQARLAAAQQQSVRAFTASAITQRTVAGGFTASAVATARMRDVLATLTPATVAAGSATRALAAIVTSATPLATAALAGFAFSSVRDLLTSRKAMDETAEKWEDTVRRLINAGDVEALKKQAQDLFLGTPAEEYRDGIVAVREEIQRLKSELGKDAAASLGGVFSGATKELARAEERLGRLTAQFDGLQSRIASTRNGLFFRSGPLAITTTATDPNGGAVRDERAAWEESRRRADQRERWELEAIGRANDLAAARLRAETPGLRTPGASALSFGGIPSTLTGGVQRLPDPFRVTQGLTVEQGQAVSAAREAIARREVMERANAEIAANFRENLQRATGATLTEFIVEGRASVRDVFATFKQLGASTIGETLSTQLARVTGGLGVGASLATGGAFAFLGTVAERFFGASERQAAAAEALERAASDRRSTFAQIGQDAARFGLDPSLTPAERDRLGAQRSTAALANDLLGAIGSRSLSTSARRAFDAARAELGEIDFDELDRFAEVLRGFAFPGDLALLERIRQAYRDNLDAQERAAALGAADSLRTFGGSLSLSQFSPLSPTAQLREARAQYEALRTRALGGDAGAAQQFQTAASTLLGLSRSVNASGGRFVADFNTVRDDTARLEALFRDRATVAEATRDAAQSTADNTQRTNELLGDMTTRLTTALESVEARLAEVERHTRMSAELAV